MKRALVSLAALLLVASYASATVIDGFESPWTYNYTEVDKYGVNFPVTSEVSGAGYTSLDAVSGSNLGKGTRAGGEGIGSGYRTRAHLADWAGAPMATLGQPVSVWCAINTSSADGGGLVVKAIDYGSGLVGGYVVGIADRFNGTEVRLQLMAHDLVNNGGGGMDFSTAGQLNSFDHTPRVQFNLPQTSAQWLKLTATLTAVGTTNVMDVVVTDINGDPVGPGSGGTAGAYQYVDSGAQAVSARADGPAGLFVWAWQGGPDFDDLDVGLTLTPGDANGDGIVNVGDLALLAANWQEGISTTGKDVQWIDADFNADHIVNVGDLALLASNWQGSGGGASVPEPATLGLLAVGGVLALLRRRR